MGYLFKNERRIVRIYNTRLRERYYIVQIADRDVDVILNWGIGNHLAQGERFGIVRFGSQVDLIVPLTGQVKYKILAREKHHVEAAVDKLLVVQ
jgi:phosphatidylserine decarboxylase